MKTWCTTIYAKCAVTGEMKKYCGPNIQAFTPGLARAWADNNGLGYCHIDGELESEIPCKAGTYDPDFSKQINFSSYQEN